MKSQVPQGEVTHFELLSRIFESSLDMISYHDSEGRYLLTTPSCREILGYSPEELKGHSAYDFVFDPDKPKVHDHHVVTQNGSSSARMVRFRAVKKDGSLVWLESRSQSVETSAGPGIVVISRDVTDSVRTEEALAHSEAGFRELYENMSEGVALHEVVFGPDGTTPVNYRILDVNPAYTRHTGLPREKAQNILATDLYGVEDPPYRDDFCRVGITGKAYRFETYFPPMKKYFSISVICPSPGKFATVFEDITSRIQREKELEDRNAELERFVYTVSHDLKSPLITIRGFSGVLQKDLERNNGEAVHADQKRIITATDKMQALLNDLLHLTKVGTVLGALEEVDLKVVVEETRESLEQLLRSSGSLLVVQDGLGRVRGDRQRLTEVYQNLIENAVKYARPGVSPRMVAGEYQKEGQRVFFLRDNGLGIDPQYADDIFELFHKLDPKSEGTGIGLALVKRIIEAHGGRIWVESDGCEGSEFCFTLGS